MKRFLLLFCSLCLTAEVSVQNIKALKDKDLEGDINAMNSLGWCYANGQGVKQDYCQAVQWYREAADCGDASAMMILDGIYKEGRGGTFMMGATPEQGSDAAVTRSRFIR